jgi:hypothetical protein
MSVKVFYVDLRNRTSEYKKAVIDWHSELTAEAAVRQAFGESVANQAVHDLDINSGEIGIAWHIPDTDEHSEIGGVGSLDWDIPDISYLTIVYEDEHTTNQQIDESSEWMIANE